MTLQDPLRSSELNKGEIFPAKHLVSVALPESLTWRLHVPDNQQKMTEKIGPTTLRSPRELRGNSFFIVARMISVRLKEGLTDREGE